MKKKQKAKNGEGCLRYDKSRKQFTCRITYTDYYGKSLRKTFYGQSEEICKKKAEEFLKIKARNLTKNQEEMTVVDILDNLYKKKYELNQIKESTYLRKMYTIFIYKNSNISNIPIVQLKINDIEKFLLSQKCKSNSDIDKIYSSLNTALKLAVSDGIIEKNLLDNERILKPKSDKQSKKVRGFTQEEQQKFLEVLKDYKPIENKNYYKNQFKWCNNKRHL